MAHRNARLTVHGRRLLIQRVMADGRPVAHVVEELGVSRATGSKRLARWRAEGDAGLADRPSTAHHIPGKTSLDREAQICALRTQLKRGPRRFAPLLVDMPASTIHAVLRRRGLPRLAWLDRPTGQPVRRYERDWPGELIHVDVKKIGRLRDGGGWRVHGRDSLEHRQARARPAAERPCAGVSPLAPPHNGPAAAQLADLANVRICRRERALSRHSQWPGCRRRPSLGENLTIGDATRRCQRICSRRPRPWPRPAHSTAVRSTTRSELGHRPVGTSTQPFSHALASKGLTMPAAGSDTATMTRSTPSISSLSSTSVHDWMWLFGQMLALPGPRG
jgi:transposase